MRRGHQQRRQCAIIVIDETSGRSPASAASCSGSPGMSLGMPAMGVLPSEWLPRNARKLCDLPDGGECRGDFFDHPKIDVPIDLAASIAHTPALSAGVARRL